MKFKSLFALVVVMLSTLTSCSLSDNPVIPEEEQPVVIQATEVTNLTPNFIASVSGIEVGQVFEKGSTFTLTLTPGYNLWGGFYSYHMEHIHVHVGDQVYTPEFPGSGDDPVQEITMTIPVPDRSFGVVVAYAVQQQLTPDGYTMRLEDNADGVELFGVSTEQKYKYFDCYLRTPDGYTIDQVEFKMGDGEWQDVNWVMGCGFMRSYEVDNVYQVTIRPDYQNVTGDVTLRVKGTQHQRSKITWKNTDLVSFEPLNDWEKTTLPETAIGGEQVTAIVYLKDANYYLAGATSNLASVSPECFAHAYVSFVMPEEDVEITLDVKEKITVTYESSAHIASAQIYSAPDIYYGMPTEKAIPGDYVYLFANAEQGYKPSKVVYGDGQEGYFQIYGGGLDAYAYYAEILVPENATSLSVRAEVKEAHRVQGENIYFNDGSYFAEGEGVAFIVSVPTGKQIESVTATDANGNNVPLEMNGAYGSFTMPNSDVTVTATFRDLDPNENVLIRAFYDDDQYSVSSQSTAYWGSLSSDGVTVPTGTTLYISVQDNYGEPFWVGVKIGDSVQYFEAQEDPDWGEYTFGRSFTFTANGDIKVGSTQNSVAF